MIAAVKFGGAKVLAGLAGGFALAQDLLESGG